MKKSLTIFLQAALVLISIAALAVLIRLPLTEGRAKNLDLFHIYADPLILFGYALSITFFVALYKAFRLLACIRQNKIFSLQAVRNVSIIKYCAIILGCGIILAGIYISVFHHKDDDPAGFLALCMAASFITAVIAAAATVFENILQKGIAIQSENEALQKQLQ